MVKEAHLTADFTAENLLDIIVCSTGSETCTSTQCKAALGLMQYVSYALQQTVLNLEIGGGLINLWLYREINKLWY
jgi:hypothetical protein